MKIALALSSNGFLTLADETHPLPHAVFSPSFCLQEGNHGAQRHGGCSTKEMKNIEGQ